MDEHKGHDTVSAAAERKDKQKEFGKKKLTYLKGMQKKEKQLQQLKQQIKALQFSGDAAVDQNEKAYAEMVRMADERRCATKDLIRVQQKAVVSRAEALVDRLEKDISELRKGQDDLKQLSLTEDHIHFLQSCQAIFDCGEADLSSDVDIEQQTPFDFVKRAISDLRDRMENVSIAIAEISQTIQADPDPQTRQELSLYSSSLSLDPNTAFENLLLSEGNRKGVKALGDLPVFAESSPNTLTEFISGQTKKLKNLCNKEKIELLRDPEKNLLWKRPTRKTISRMYLLTKYPGDTTMEVDPNTATLK
ncbi:hypothetical protein CgunFtcFv8_013394 [Champsocephalus gunnari]|uniref:TRIM8/14/16/25/29/45/65 coiled-coil region domain-containing protein n=1 Tax=Champsocephalus gunnari TaxID=52237 RepID=A0AAN8DSF7_CHAGU|nr:hypothetical protein CgunFtcFv8_013394 [Champsocephalus gunnari]